jgi:hypothetical protein
LAGSTVTFAFYVSGDFVVDAVGRTIDPTGNVNAPFQIDRLYQNVVVADGPTAECEVASNRHVGGAFGVGGLIASTLQLSMYSGRRGAAGAAAPARAGQRELSLRACCS